MLPRPWRDTPGRGPYGHASCGRSEHRCPNHLRAILELARVPVRRGRRRHRTRACWRPQASRTHPRLLELEELVGSLHVFVRMPREESSDVGFARPPDQDRFRVLQQRRPHRKSRREPLPRQHAQCIEGIASGGGRCKFRRNLSVRDADGVSALWAPFRREIDCCGDACAAELRPLSFGWIEGVVMMNQTPQTCAMERGTAWQ